MCRLLHLPASLSPLGGPWAQWLSTCGFPCCRDLEKHPGLDPFEVAQLGNLCPKDAQEAKTLIPSLNMPHRDFDNSALSELLEQLDSFRQYPT